MRTLRLKAARSIGVSVKLSTLTSKAIPNFLIMPILLLDAQYPRIQIQPAALHFRHQDHTNKHNLQLIVV